MNDIKFWNAKITNVSLSMADHGCLTFSLALDGGGIGGSFGGYVLGSGYLGADEFEGSAAGMECMMRIMDTVGVERWEDLKGEFVRVRDDGWGESIKCIGHITKNKWFDIKEFFDEKKEEKPKKPIPKDVAELRDFVGNALKEQYEKVQMRRADDDIIVNVEETVNGRNDVWIQFPYFHSRS